MSPRRIQLYDVQGSSWWPSGAPAGNLAPSARLTGPSTAQVGSLLTYDTSDSWDPQGDPVTSTVVLAVKPAGSSATLQSAGNGLFRLSPDVAGTYRITNTTTDDGGAARGAASPEPLNDVASITLTATAVASGERAGEEGMRRAFGGLVINDNTQVESHEDFERQIGRKVHYVSMNMGNADRVPPLDSGWIYEVNKTVDQWRDRINGPSPVTICSIINIFGASTRPAAGPWQQELRNVANGLYDDGWIEGIDILTAAGFRNWFVPRIGHEADLRYNMSSKWAFITNPSSLAHMQEMEALYKAAIEHVMWLWTSRGYKVSYPGNGGWFQTLGGATWLGSTTHAAYRDMKLWEFALPDPQYYYDFGCDIYINTGRRFPEFMAMVREMIDTATLLGKPWSIPEWAPWAQTLYTEQEIINGVNAFLDLITTCPATGPGSPHYFNYFFAGERDGKQGQTRVDVFWPQAFQKVWVERLGTSEVSLPGTGTAPAPEPEPEPEPTTTYDVLVTTDLGGDPDDIQSLVHLVQNTDVLKVKGIVSTVRVSGDAGVPSLITEWIRRTDPDHLRTRGLDVMSEAALLATVKTGSRSRGVPTAGRATQGSTHIISTVNNGGYSKANPLWILSWGPITDIAQALYTDPSIYTKIRIYSIGDYNTLPGDPDSREWMLDFLDTHRDLWWIENGVMPRESRSTFRGVWNGGNQSGEWHPKTFLNQNIRDHGTTHSGAFTQKLGDALPVGDSPTGSVAVGGLKEGDSPSFMYLLSPVHGGVGDVNNPAAESWGGRFRRPQAIYPNYWVDLNLTPSQCQQTINKWRAPASGGYLRHWKSRWNAYDGPAV